MSALPFPPLLERLGLTLLHALWLLTALALVAWVGLALLRRASAQTRYLWACACLVTMPVACGAAFALLGNPDPGPVPLAVLQTVPVSATMTSPPPSFWEGLRGPVAPWLALAWLAGALVQVLRLGGAVWRVQRIFLREAEPAPPAWEQACRQLARYLGMAVPVRLLVSAKVSTPLTLGWLRPVVLLPASSLLHLTPEALEAVLAHELAHVRRLDYLANLLQTLIDALLFFHPSARWLSGQIRELREHCCDDEAAALCGDPVVLAQGLTALERLRRNPESAPEPALAAARGSLMSRITRMLAPQPAPLPAWRGLALVLAAASLVGAATLALPQKQPTPAPARSIPAMTTLTMPPLAGTGGFEHIQAKGGQRWSYFSNPSGLKLMSRGLPPHYPAAARMARIQGTVECRMQVGPDGTVQRAEALSGPEELREATQNWGLTWRFEQSSQGGEVIFRQTFRISRAEEQAAARVAAQEGMARAQTGATLVSASDPALRVEAKGAVQAYPPIARMARIQGDVDVELVVTPNGTVSAVKALSGPPQLRLSAEKAALGWTFAPTVKGGTATVRIPFRLE